MRKTLLSLSLALPLAACGKDGTKGSDAGQGTSTAAAKTEPTSMTIADEASLPTCDESRQGFLVYVNSSKTFQTCDAGAWVVIDGRGPQGDAGAKGDQGAQGERGYPGESGSLMQAIELYETYKRSVFRLTLTCGAPTNANGCGDGTIFLGSGFLCGAKTVCTNAHVVTCDSACNGPMTSLKVHGLEAGADSLNPDGSQAAQLANITTTSGFRFSSDTTRDVDLVKFNLPTAPAGVAVIPIAAATFQETISPLQQILSLSYPLGLQDLYVDLGQVNTPFIGECDTQGGLAGYGCPSAFYDFSTTNDTDHGSSGSPLIDLKTGLVVGVTSAGTDGENANYTWAIDAQRLSQVPLPP